MNLKLTVAKTAPSSDQLKEPLHLSVSIERGVTHDSGPIFSL
jgi:hypothetical protein